MTVAAIQGAVHAPGRSRIEAMSHHAGLMALTGAVFLAPYLTWRPFDLMFTASDALFCLAAVFLGFGGALARQPFGALTSLWLLAFVTMVTGLFIGSVVNGEPLRWATAAAQYGFGLVILPYLLIGHGTARTTALAKALLAGLVAMELFGIGVYFLFDGSFEDHQKFGLEFISGTRRLGVFTSDANWNGACLAMALPFVVYLRAKHWLRGWQALLAGTVLVAGLFLAASVSALVSAVVGLMAMVFVSGNRVPARVMTFGAIAIAAWLALGLPLPQAFGSRVAPAIDSGNIGAAGTFTGRFELIREAWRMVGDTMFVGLGVDQFRVVSRAGAPVHNMYLLLWTEGGLLALFGWLLLLVLLVAAAALIYRRDRVTAALALAVVAAFVVGSTGSPHMYARLWLVPVMLAMAFVFDRANQEDRQ